MSDPLSQIITLLRPRAVFTKGISGAGKWGVRYSSFGHPGFCTVIEGSCRLAVDGQEPLVLEQGDFVLLPTTPGFTMSGFEEVEPSVTDPHTVAGVEGEVRHGDPDGPPSVRLMGGYFRFESPDSALQVSLLPAQIRVRGVSRLSELVEMLREEAAEQQPGRELVLERLVEVLLIEALRVTKSPQAAPGLLRGLADDRLAEVLRQIHSEPARPWTSKSLAATASLSRSAFFERFTKQIGIAPAGYLLAWRIALAKDMLRKGGPRLEAIAERVGYGSASALSTAFRRHVGESPGQYGKRVEEYDPTNRCIDPPPSTARRPKESRVGKGHHANRLKTAEATPAEAL